MNRIRQFFGSNPMVLVFMGIEGFYWMAGTAASYQSVYLKGLGLSTSVIGYITALCSAIAIIASPIWGVLCDKLRDSRKVSVICIGIGAVTWALIPFTSSWMLGPVTFLLFMLPFNSFFRTPGNTLMETVVLDGCTRNSISFSKIRTSGSLFYALFCLVLVRFLPVIGYEYIFYYYGLLMLPALILIWISGRGGKPVTIAKPLSLREMHLGSLLANSNLVCFMIFNFCCTLPMNTSFTYMPYLLEDVGSTDGMIGLIVGLRALMEIPGLLGIPWMCRKMSVKNVLVLSGILVGAEHLLYSVASNLPTVLILSVLHGFSSGIRIALVLYYVKALAPSHLQATALTVNATVGNLASILGNVIAGSLIAALGIRGFYGLMGGILIAGLVFWVISLRFTPKVQVEYQ